MLTKTVATIGQCVSVIAFGGLLALAGGCAAPVDGTEAGAAAKGSTPAASAETPRRATEEARAVEPETGCRPPLVTCACEIGGDIEPWCTTATICWHVCGDRVP